MRALRAMSDQFRASNRFSFTARTTCDEPDTNGQMLDFIKYSQSRCSGQTSCG
jgi:hypothetical protein